MTAGMHSRSEAAGYSVETMRAAKVLVVGIGALGQNVLQNLALSGIGQLAIVDFDKFEPHNATRSPFFPSPREKGRLGLSKAAIVATRLARINTMSGARVYYAADTIQRVGNGAVRWADVVVSAVDSTTARAWLAEQCRLLGKPLVEGGFSGAKFNVVAFAPDSGAACYRCAHPERTSSASCTQYALRAEAARIVPAIQSTAAMLGGLQAELVMTILHGRDAQYGRRLYGNLRTREFTQSTLQPDPNCPGEHERLSLADSVPLPPILGELMQTLGARGFRHFIPSEPILLSNNCTACRAMCVVEAPESTWLLQPRCRSCNGPWAVAPSIRSPQSLRVMSIAEPDERARCLTLDALGVREGGVVHVLDLDGSGLGVPLGDDACTLDEFVTVPGANDATPLA